MAEMQSTMEEAQQSSSSQSTFSSLPSFHNKVALVTGGSRGIGYGIVVALLQCHAAKIYCVSRNPFQLETEDEEILVQNPQEPGRAPVQLRELATSRVHSIICDLVDWDATETKLNQHIHEVVDLVVNNAGTGVLEEIPQVKLASAEMTMKLNFLAPLNVSQFAVRRLLANKKPGAIVNVSSQASQRALWAHSAYCASKAALDALTRNMALELGAKNIRVNSVNPTVVLTELGRIAWSDPQRADGMIKRIPLRRFAEVEHVVRSVLFLLSDKWSGMTTGTCLPVEGGFWCA